MREIVFDTETTGLSPQDGHKVIEIGCVELIDRQESGRTLHLYINPKRDIPEESFKIHGLSAEFLQDKPTFKEIAQEFLHFVQNSPVIAHNAAFDLRFINHELESIGHRGINPQNVIDTLQIARKKFPGAPASLDALCKRFNISLAERSLHGALVDAKLLSAVYIRLRRKNSSLFDLNAKQETSEQIIRKVEFPRRSFTPTEQEIEAHAEMLSALKGALWYKYQS